MFEFLVFEANEADRLNIGRLLAQLVPGYLATLGERNEELLHAQKASASHIAACLYAEKELRKMHLSELLSELDTSEDGRVRFDELLDAVRNRFSIPETQIPDQAVQSVFHEIDTNNSGFIDLVELTLFITKSVQAGWNTRSRLWNQGVSMLP